MINWLQLAQLADIDHKRALQVLRNYQDAGRYEAFLKQIYVCLHKYHVTKFCTSRHHQQCIERHIRLIDELTKQTDDLTRRLNKPD